LPHKFNYQTMDQSCINVRAIPSFKFLTEHYDVSEDTLKEIIYKYRIETNNGEAVPTIAYINAQIGKTQYVDANPLAKELWDKSYSTPKEFSTEEAFKGAKEKALKFFPENAIVTYTNSNGNRVLAIKEPVQKINPYHRKDFKTWQEYNDYLLTMGDLVPVEERDKEEQVIGNQPFTFNDGTTVTVPFKPNSQQEEALNAMNDFLKSNETSMTLSGFAGTGKTSLMEIIAKKAKKEHRKIVFSASTNKAAAVLRNRIKSAGFDAQTLNKVFGIQVEVDTNKPYDASNLVNKLKEANITPGTVVVIDEASMINEENFRILNGIAQENDLKIIYVGDKGQLAPVNESQVSKVFRNNTGRIVNLTKVERTEDNAILKEATDIRSGKPLSGESSFNKEGKGVAYVKKSNKAAIKAIVEKFVPKLKENPDYFRILAYTNAAVARYNEAVRRALGYTDNTPRVNEPIVGYNNWGYVWDKNGGTYRFINSEAYKVTKVGKSKEVNWSYPINGVKVKLTYTPVTLEDAMGKSQIIDFIDIKGNEENRKNATILAKEKARLWREAMSYPKGSKMRLSILNQVNEIEDFLFVNDNIVDDIADSKGKHPVLQKKVFDFGYAMTVHKSQGSTFTNVMVDDADISTARNTTSSWNDVLLGDNVSLDMGEEFDESSMEVQESGNLVDLINNTPTTPLASPATTDTNSTNLRQQLEYVAVSRATDTVTVIASDANVKKEDTPLNHLAENNQSKSTINKEESRSNNKQQEYGNDFRRIQERVRKDSQGSSVLRRDIGEDARRRLARITKLELDSHTSPQRNSQWTGISNKGVHYNIIGEIPAQLFHDFFEVVRYYTENGELVDLHDDYSNCKCFLSDDGTCGFAIEPDGSLISVFNLGLNRGFLSAIKDIVITQGATHLDAFDSNVQPLKKIYEHTLGAKVASSMDYNMEFDHDDIANNHSNPDVVFMVMGEAAEGQIEEKHFNKDQHDEAKAYQQSFLSQQPTQQASVPEASPSEIVSHPVQLTNLGVETGERVMQVDQAWKEPILLDLDSQLGMDTSEEEKADIIAQMHRVQQATSEEDYNKAPTPERKEVNDKMSDYWRRNNQMNALIENEVGLTASEIREVSEQIVNSISDIITEIQANPEKAKEYFPTYNADIDLSKVSRKEIARAIKIDNLIQEAKRRFENIRYDESNSEAYELYNNSFELMDQADLILDNWDTIMELAADVFLANEGFSIKRDTKGQRFELSEKEFTGYDYDNFVDLQDEDAIREEKDEQEHWQVEVKTISAINSMSDLVRLAYHNCYLYDKDGNKVLDKWGIPKRVNKVTAVAQTLRWTQGTLNMQQMIQKLEQKKAKNPWLQQLIDRLNDTSGKEADFQSQFYGVMHRHFQLYDIGQLDKGTYSTKTLNNHVALTEIMKGISAKFQLNGHPLFSKDGSVNKDDLERLKGWHKQLTDIVKKYNIRIDNRQVISNTELSDEDFNTAVKCLSAASRMLGYDISEDAMKEIVTEDALYKMQNKLGFAIDTLDKQVGKKDENYNPFDYEVENNIRNEVMGFLTPIVEELEDIATNAFFESGKMYQTYVIPSFLTQLFDHFKQDFETFQQWVDNAYGQSEWFKDKKGNWRLDMLDLMVRSEKAREVFAHKVQLNFNKHDYMRNMSPEEFTLSVLTEHFSERLDMKNLEQTPAWFRVPIQSNKPSSEFIRFYADRSTKYKDNIAEKMYHMFLQELSRIDTVRKRNKKKGDAGFIASFDENGGKFHFLPFLNQYLEENNHSELGNLLKDKVKAERELSEQEDKRLMDLVQEETKKAMQERIDKILDSWDNTGILKAAEKIQGIKILNRSVRENLENYLWNDFYMTNAILQLTIVDKAFYPNATELQKRLAELHAPGTRGYKEARDYKGNRVSDGYHRTVLIKDFDGFVANIIDNIAIVFDRKIAAAPEREKAGLKALKESLVGENGAYRKINVTDGEAYSCISSYRKKAFMFGKWSHKAEEIYDRLRNGDYTLSDLEVAFQPLKPFIYGHVQKSMGVAKAPITQIPVPFQAKNAEYLLIMADALTRDEDTGRPNLLRAIFNIMEESERRFPTQGIDTVGFNSTIKSGEQGAIDLTEYVTMEGGEAGAYKLMESLIFQDAKADDLTNYNYNDYVHKIDYDNYALQQEVPAHFREHEQVELSQLRMNIPADLDFYNFDGEVNLYSWKDPDGTEHKMNAKEFRKEYERVHADNIEKGLNQLSKELHLDSTDKKARNLALSEILQNEIISSPRYGLDLFLACQIDPATGEFRIPKGDPIQGKRIEQLINSIIKNRVNKLTVSGGPIVQVTNFGTSKQLHIRFTDKQGNIMPTKEEYEAEQHDESYQEYCAKNQAGIAHFEIFAPIGMKQVFDKFKNPDGTIDIDAVEKCDPELLKVITGRCPNEDKYSIAHGKIVGFMPALAGDAIMFPYELTEIDDSDFDVDKRYTMQKSVDIVEDTSKIKQSLFNRVVKSYQAAHSGQISHSKKQELRDAVNMLMDNPERMKTVDNLMGSLYQEYQKILQEEKPYKTKYPKKGSREANNNQIIDMCWAVMSNEMTADKVLNPGGFEAPKHTAYVIAAYKNNDGTIHFEDLEKMSTKELQKIASTEMDLAWFDDHVQFYKQNAAGSNLIGVFAVNKVAHAILEGDNILINIQDFCGEKPFTICDMVFDGMMPLDSAKDTKGMLVGKNLGSGVGASADTAKDPWLDRININMTTVGMFNSLLRMRMPMDDAELFMAQDVIFRLMNEFNRRSLENKGTSLDDIIQEKLDIIKKKNGYTEASEINTQALTREELIQGLIPIKSDNSDSREAIEYKTLLAFSKIKTLSKAIRKPTLVTRLNSMSAAVGPLIIDNIILWHKLSEFLDINCENGKTGFYVKNEDGTFSTVDMDDILYDHPILRQFSIPVDVRNSNCPTKILFSDMPAGSSLFQAVLKALPANINDKIYDDRALLSKLSDFFQSYLLVANNVIKPNDLKYLIEDFPKEFEGIGESKNKSAKVQYPNNAFIQAIQLNYEKKSNRASLNVNTTGMSEQEKERLRMAWTDLHKINPELSMKLFTYAFFRGGIGFSPKTFMGLVPTYVKERIPGYVDTYRHFPQIIEKTVLDQFIRNNWDNSTLVPLKGGEGTNYDIDLDKGVLIVRSENDKKDLAGIKYMKTTDGNQTYLWRLLGEEIENRRERYYERVTPLGNNGEYVEMSIVENVKAMDNTTTLEIEEKTPEMPEVSPMENTASDVDTPTTVSESDAQQTKNIINWISLQNRISMEEAGEHFEKLKKATKNGTDISKGYKHYLVNLFKQAGLQLSLDEAAAKFKEFC